MTAPATRLATAAGSRRTPGRSSSSLRYLPALDGMRGFAVLAVIVYHFAPGWLPAGFLGVDLFFVVSGFLITRLLMAELSDHDGIRLRTFWGRRVRRLLPGVTTMMLLVAVIALARSSDAQLNELRTQLVAALAYVANWNFIVSKSSYFAASAGPSPLLHVWSLAIEEQFYLVFPFVLLGLRRKLRLPRATLALVLVIGAVGSAALMALLYSPADPSRVYYGTDTHAMGLLLGAGLAVAIRAERDPTPNRHRMAPVLGAPTIALVLLVLMMRFATESSHWLYRGGFLVFAGACCIVVADVFRGPTSTAGTVFSSRALVAVGLRSYSLYLWHWPVRVFVNEPATHQSGIALLLIRVGVLVAASELSFRLVERTFRTGGAAQRYGTRAALGYCAVVSLAVLLLAARMPASGPPTTLAAVIASNRSAATTSAAAIRIDVFGDSTALAFAFGQQPPNVHLDGAAQVGCGIVAGDYQAGGRRIQEPDDCSGWLAQWSAKLLESRPDATVLMTGAWDILDHEAGNEVVRFGTPEWTSLVEGAVDDTFDRLQGGGAPVFVFEVPCYGDGDPELRLPQRAEPERRKALNAIFTKAASQRSGVHILPYTDYVCPGDTRADTIEGVSMWQPDDVHLSVQGASLVWRWLLPQVTAQLSAGSR